MRVLFVLVAKLLPMLNKNCLVWNVRGLNSRSRHNVVCELVGQENISLLSLQETKLNDCSDSLVLEICGAGFDYFFKRATHTCGGILLAWRTDVWSITNPLIRSNSLTAKVTLLHNGDTWWWTSVYGPQGDHEKLLFLDELREVRGLCPDTWLVWGCKIRAYSMDWNVVPRAQGTTAACLYSAD